MMSDKDEPSREANAQAAASSSPNRRRFLRPVNSSVEATRVSSRIASSICLCFARKAAISRWARRNSFFIRSSSCFEAGRTGPRDDLGELWGGIRSGQTGKGSGRAGRPTAPNKPRPWAGRTMPAGTYRS